MCDSCDRPCATQYRKKRVSPFSSGYILTFFDGFRVGDFREIIRNYEHLPLSRRLQHTNIHFKLFKLVGFHPKRSVISCYRGCKDDTNTHREHKNIGFIKIRNTRTVEVLKISTTLKTCVYIIRVFFFVRKKYTRTAGMTLE